LAWLLDVDPGRTEWRALIDRYIAAAGPAIDELIPDEGQRYSATEALRAYLWQNQGRTADAILRLLDATDALGDPRYLNAWAWEWLEPEGAVEALPAEVGTRLFGTLLTKSSEVDLATAPQLRFRRRWAALVKRAAPRYPRGGLRVMLEAGLLRKAGQFD